MRGISEEFLKGILGDSNHQYKMSAPYINAQRKVIQALISQCKELNPWLPIDENTPKDKNILVYAPPYQDLQSLQQVCKWHESAGFCIDALRTPTHYQELPDDPK